MENTGPRSGRFPDDTDTLLPLYCKSGYQHADFLRHCNYENVSRKQYDQREGAYYNASNPPNSTSNNRLIVTAAILPRRRENVEDNHICGRRSQRDLNCNRDWEAVKGATSSPSTSGSLEAKRAVRSSVMGASTDQVVYLRLMKISRQLSSLHAAWKSQSGFQRGSRYIPCRIASKHKFTK